VAGAGADETEAPAGADEAGPAGDETRGAEARRHEVWRSARRGADRTGPPGVARLRAAGETPRAS